MKRLLCLLALVLGSSAVQAQVYFEPNSTRPINPGAANGQISRAQHARAPVKVRYRLVRCRDGSQKRTLRMCRHRGGVARR
ncbi:MAG: hypothetical protein V4631_00235 [Pseudomonadota bacterium]